MAKIREEEYRKDSPTNPYGSNQFMLDPRQLTCWKYYTDHKSETFGSARGSAIRAGYDEEYASQITTSEWFLAKVRRMNMLSKAEKVLNETLEIDHTESGKVVPSILSIKNDVAKFLAKTQGKNEGYSERHEHTGKDGADLPTPIAILSNLNALPSNNGNEEDSKPKEENKSSAGRNVVVEDSIDTLIAD